MPFDADKALGKFEGLVRRDQVKRQPLLVSARIKCVQRLLVQWGTVPVAPTRSHSDQGPLFHIEVLMGVPRGTAPGNPGVPPVTASRLSSCNCSEVSISWLLRMLLS
jgi:hypothetical protein